MQKIGVIGGSGIYQLDGIEVKKRHAIQTPYGQPSNEIIEAQINGVECYFLPRHGEGHRLLPHEVNYRANIYALKMLGIDYIISISAVGSLKEELEPTKFVLVDQFIDWTKGKRERTFFGEGVVAHVSNADPINLPLQKIISEACQATGMNFSVGGTYLCIEGPQFSTRAESAIYRSFGASVIGMTNVPEAFLAKEAGMSYATIAMVTDYDCWKEEHCTVEEIMKVMKTNNQNAQSLLKDLIPRIAKNPPVLSKETASSIMTASEGWPANKREILEVLLK